MTRDEARHRSLLPRTKAGYALVVKHGPVLIADVIATEDEAVIRERGRLYSEVGRLSTFVVPTGVYVDVSDVLSLLDEPLSDPDAERQRAIGEAVERLDNATLPSTSLEIQKPSDWTLGLGQTDRKDWLVNVWDGSDSLATALGRDLVEMIDRVIASLSKSSCDCPSFDAEAERDCCCVGGEACRPAAALPAAQEPER
jgi:hypothetical protein